MNGLRKSMAGKGLAVLLSISLMSLSFQGCGGSGNTLASEKTEADIVLSGTNADVAAQLGGQYDAVSSLAKNPGKRLAISLERSDGQSPVMVELMFNPDGQPIIIAPDGRRALIEIGLRGIKPVVRLVNPGTGEIYLEQAIETPASKLVAGELTVTDWITTGMAVVGAAIVVWLGLKVVGLAAAGLGYLALAAIVVGAVVIGAGVITRVFNLLGWEAADLVDLFRQSASDLALMISGAVKKFQEVYNL